MTTVTAPQPENPKTAADLNLIPRTTVDDSSTGSSLSLGGAGDVSKDKRDASAKVRVVDSASAVTDAQKKMKRAERFGIAVQISEAEKFNSRAERFGTASAVNGSDSSKQAEELKRKARAERFGTIQSAPTPDDEEVKKKARLARFESAAKTASVEEEKKRARAARFSQLDAGTKSNGNDIPEVKKADAVKAGGGT